MRPTLAASALLLPALAPLLPQAAASTHSSPHHHHGKNASAAGATADLLASASETSDASLLWGTYRPQLYLGVRPRLPKSLMMGAMWWGSRDHQSFAKARHVCDQGDDIQGYAWTKHDGRTFGEQYVRDVSNNVNFTMSILKSPGGDAGGSWALRIKGEPITPHQPMRITLLHYFGLEGLGALDLDNAEDDEGLEGKIKLTGSTPQLGDFRLRIEHDDANHELTRGPHADDFGALLESTTYLGIKVPPDSVWKAQEYILGAFTPRIQSLLDRYPRDNFPDPGVVFTLPNELRYGANLLAFSKTYENTFTVDLFYDSLPSSSSARPSGTIMDGESLTVGLKAAAESYDARFETTFPGLVDGEEFSPEQIAFAQEMTASLVGGIGYFQGTQIVDRHFRHEYDDDEREEGSEPRPEMMEERELFTSTPSRPFFPRGFYWDEGFHLLLIGEWDNDLSLEILKSWIDQIDEDGWVAREQILGDEARSKVPKEFMTQYPAYANPPTLAMAVTAYIRRLRARGTVGGSLTDADLGLELEGQGRPAVASMASTSSPEALSSRFLTEPALARAYLASIYPKLRRHYDWFRRTQRGDARTWGRRGNEEAYRWRGRTADHVLTSGMDDYPRAKPPHIGELHVDLLSWMGFFTRTMREIAEFVGENEDAEEFARIYDAILKNLDDLHWNEQRKMYCDVSVNEDDESYHVCHKGYISIFPFLLGLLSPSSPHLKHVFDDVHSREHLWSDFGIRSLAKSEEMFGQGENYWRGPIWVPVNYLALSSLNQIYTKQKGPHQKKAQAIYKQLRENLIENTFEQWQKTAYVWEQYDAVTGEGKRSRPFTGWTSLVTLIMAEQYP